jgi:DNA invertase Pin-like site-specific DNA recombinase
MPYNVLSVEFKNKLWLMYLRKSRADNPDESVEEVLSKHEKLLQEWAKRELGYEIPAECIYREVVSGGESIEDREEIQKVLARIENPDVAGVICVDPQRLSRGSLTDCDLLIDKLRYTKTLVVTPVMTYDLENKMERRFFQDELMRGRDYLDYVKEVLYRGRYQSAARGCVVGAPPYGYNKIKIGKDWTLEPNENADIVRMIFNWYAKDFKSPGQICKELDRMMVPPPKAKKWGREYLLRILKNVHYDGKVVFGSRKTTVVFENGKKVTKRIMQDPEDMLIVEGKHPAIIDHDIFTLTQERLADRAYTIPRTNKELTTPFAGLLKCPVCGYAMTYHSGRKHKSFNCKSYCSKVITYPVLADAVKTALLTEHLPELEEKRKSGAGESVTIQRQLIDRLEKQMADFKAQEAKQYDLLETGIYSNELFLERNAALREKINACSGQLEEAKRKLPKAVNYEEKIITLKEAINALDDDDIPVEKKNRLLKAVIEKIEYSSPKHQPYGVNEFTLSITLNI